MNSREIFKPHRTRRFTAMEVVLCTVVILTVAFLSVWHDLKEANDSFQTSVDYVKTQCSIYSRYNSAAETKTIMRIIGGAKQIAKNIENNSFFDETILKRYADEEILTGVIILDENGIILCDYVEDRDISNRLNKYIQRPNVLDVAKYPNKTYATHIPFEDGSYVNLAANGRNDKPGVIIAYYYTNPKYASNYNLTVQSLLSGYDIVKNGTVVIADGLEVVASNDKTIYNIDTDENASVRGLKRSGVMGKMTRVQDGLFGYYGMMDKSRNYYIYVYMPAIKVFRNTPMNLVFAVLICLFILFVINLIRYDATKRYSEENRKKEAEYQELLKQSANESQQANIAKTEFLHRMSHDIRTPINGIRGMLEIADRFEGDLERQADCRKKIWDASGILLELINEILDMGKLESGEIILEEVPFNLRELIEQTIPVLEKQAAESEITIIKNEYRVNHWNLMGSPAHLRRMIINIISNAIKYNRRGGRIILDFEELQCRNGLVWIQFLCEDTGVGMSEEFQRHIFEPFAQEIVTARGAYGGTGLGMPITKKLVDKIGGSIDFKSKQNKGTTFRMRLPFKICDAEEKPKEEVEDKEKISLSGKTVIVAEDNDLNMEIVYFFLTSVGANVIKAKDGNDVIEIFKNSHPGEIDIILMDIMMPGMGGIEATEIIRSLKRFDSKTVPIIAMTAKVFVEDKKKAIDAGMNEHLSKPIDITALLNVVAKYVCK